ncbi:MAG: hypothetical protein WEA34_12805 [Gemmatimonadota bacterium]
MSAQSLGWQAAASVLVDTDAFGGTRVGPGLTGVALVRPDRPLSYTLTLTVARTDFRVESDELHRNHGAVALGVRYAPPRDGPRVGVTMGLGVLAWDDVSETDPTFRSGADADAMLFPGVEVSIPAGSVRIDLALRDLMTGWWNALLDPAEGDVRHRVTASIGIELGS